MSQTLCVCELAKPSASLACKSSICKHPEKASLFEVRGRCFAKKRRIKKMVEKSMEMTDAGDALDAQSKSPMGPEPDAEAPKKPEDDLTASGDASEDAGSSKSKWWLWVVVFLVGLAIGVVGSMLLF